MTMFDQNIKAGLIPVELSEEQLKTVNGGGTIAGAYLGALMEAKHPGNGSGWAWLIAHSS
jgi:hypothetical protein